MADNAVVRTKNCLFGDELRVLEIAQTEEILFSLEVSCSVFTQQSMLVYQVGL